MTRVVRHVATAGALLGEGPLWDDQRQCLWFVDIKSHALLRFDPASGAVTRIAAPGQIGWLLPDSDGLFVAGLQGGLYRFDPANDQFRFLAAVPDEPASNRLNDACALADGSIWFGSMDDAERAPTGRFYRYADGHVTPAGPTAMAISNGPTASPDGKTIYFTDTLAHVIMAASVTADGLVGPATPLIELDPAIGHPDGPTVDAEGAIWTGLYGGWGVQRYAPDGRLLEEVKLPVSACTKIAFGGPDLRTAYVTTARKHLSPERLAAEPLAGDLFAFDAPAPGLLSPRAIVRPANSEA